MKLICFYLIIIFTFSCYGVNEETSNIAPLNTECLSKDAWDIIKSTHSTESIKNLELINAVKDIEKEPFTSEILYFQNNPEELIAVATDHYSIRYVFNLEINKNILNGFQLSENEKKRIQKRIQLLLIEYQCEEGRKKSLSMLHGNLSD